MTVPSTSVDSYLEDSSGYRGEAERVFLPSDVSEIREIVLTCSSERIPLTVAGAGTGLTGARVPHGGWVISLAKFRNIEIGLGTARCGAGALLSDLQRAAASNGQFFGPNPTESSASIGGIISTNAGGARSFHYGAVRRHVLALDVILMDGQLLHVKRGDRVDFPVKPVRMPTTTKNSAGYYLRPGLEWVDLFSGSEGTLGIVTQAELKLQPDPAAILSGVVFFCTDDDALSAVDAWRQLPELRFLEFIDGNSLAILRTRYPEIPKDGHAALLIEQNLPSEDDPEVDLWADRLQKQRAFEDESWFGFTAADRERFREFRHTLALMVLEIVRHNGFPKFVTDFAVPLHRNRELHEYYKRRCEEAMPGQYTIFGHVGDANNHVNLLPRTTEQAKQSQEMLNEFARFVVSMGGTVAAEHGIGKNKTDLLKLMYSADEIEAMRDVKRRLDPAWLLGRGNIFAV
ncbi:MAG: FAD-binding oxidoreductase [Acidobacteriales bacterium]|nr:FAD-binding oxidoreductase [Terriglobales bacterium]